MDIRIRPLAPEDHVAILALLPRLLVGLPSWRDAIRWMEASRRTLEAALSGANPDGGVLVAASRDDNRVLGFISMTRNTNFSGEPQLYIEDIAVVPEAEGHGIARALLAAAEHSARSLGIRFLALDVNAENTHARAVYGHYGFAEESLRLVKPLAERDASPT